jgi:hypothetical protein
MGMLGKTASFGLAWSAAILTLIGGAAHFDCRCPDGHLKAYCPGSALHSSGCCCGTTCCSAAAGANSCCRAGDHGAACGGGHHPEARHQSCPVGLSRASGACCQMTLAPAPSYTRAGPQRLPIHGKTIALGLAPADPVATVLAPSHTGGFGSAHLRSPPPDLVTLLQRLVI